MKQYVGKITIASFQMEDIVNILLSNHYVLEIENYTNNRVQISIYEVIKREEKGKEN